MNHQTGSNQLLNEELIMEKSLIGENSKVADFGCGMHGYFVYPIAKKIGKHGFIYAVDVLKNVLENLKKSIEQENIVNAKTIWSDLEVLNGTDISPNSLDVGLLINTLHQSQKRANIIKEVTRLLKQDAILTIIDWKNIATPLGPSKENKVNPDNLKKALPKMGFRLEEEFEAGKYHYGLVFRKM